MTGRNGDSDGDVTLVLSFGSFSIDVLIFYPLIGDDIDDDVFPCFLVVRLQQRPRIQTASLLPQDIFLSVSH